MTMANFAPVESMQARDWSSYVPNAMFIQALSNWTVNKEDILFQQIDQQCRIEEIETVSVYLTNNHELYELLLRFLREVDAYFPMRKHISLEIEKYEEGEEKLYALVHVHVDDTEAAIEALDMFDMEWWAPQYKSYGQKINFDLEFEDGV